MSAIGDLVDAIDDDQPAQAALARIFAAVREQARIDGLWLATVWQYWDREVGVWAHVQHADALKDCPDPGTPWVLTCSSTDDWTQHLDGSWYATAGEAKTALAAEVLEHRMAVTK